MLISPVYLYQGDKGDDGQPGTDGAQGVPVSLLTLFYSQMPNMPHLFSCMQNTHLITCTWLLITIHDMEFFNGSEYTKMFLQSENRGVVRKSTIIGLSIS